MELNIFILLAIVVVVAMILSFIMNELKQPPIIGYIITGIITSPIFLITEFSDSVEVFSKIGVSFLLFIVGLGLNPSVIKDVGKISLFTGIGQVIFTSIFGFIISFFLGFGIVPSIYIAVALTFSSTIIIMKLLTDKGDTETLYGRISIGFLIIQDLIAVIALIFISSMSEKGVNIGSVLINTFLKGVVFIIFLFLIGIYVLPHIIKRVAKSQEVLLIFSIGWCLGLASIFYLFNLSIEIGALLAGVTLSLSPFRFEISSRMKPLRDFFIIIFFILLGSQMTFSTVFEYIVPIIIFSIFILVGNPLIVLIIMGLFGYTKKTGFSAGLTVAQISEFSMILIILGINVGHLNKDILSLITAVGLITIVGSTYMILYSNKIYPLISKYLSIFERKGKKIDESKIHKEEDFDIILFGYNRIGFDLLESLQKLKKKFLVIDFNPDTIKELQKKGIHSKYGDAGDSELLGEINFKSAKMIISTIPDVASNLLLLKRLKEENKKAIVVIVSYDLNEAFTLYENGATYVLMPHYLGGLHIGTMIEDYGFDIRKFLKEQVKQVERLKKHSKLRKDHPVRREENHRHKN